MANRSPFQGLTTKRGFLRQIAAASNGKRRGRFADDALPDFRTMKPGDVVEVVRVAKGAPTPEGFTELPKPTPSHHDRFSERRAVRKLGPRKPAAVIGE